MLLNLNAGVRLMSGPITGSSRSSSSLCRIVLEIFNGGHIRSSTSPAEKGRDGWSGTDHNVRQPELTQSPLPSVHELSAIIFCTDTQTGSKGSGEEEEGVVDRNSSQGEYALILHVTGA